MLEKDRDKALAKIKNEVLNLPNSILCGYRRENKYLPVIGSGSSLAKIIFIGEAPGRNEAKTGEPFCGSAGKILDELLLSVGLSRQEIYITNIIKDRPPKNRDPLPEEIKIYGPFLDRQIEIIQPEIIVTLGRYSMDYIMRLFGLDLEIEPISRAHGKSYEARASYGRVKIIPLYHPAAVIYNQSLKKTLREDFQVLKML